MSYLLAWLRQRSWDWAKIGAVLYVAGILISSTYFLRFSILSLDLLRPQSLIVGLYFVFLYLILPATFLLILKPLRSNGIILITFLVLLATKEMMFRWLIAAPLKLTIMPLVLAQLGLFCRTSRRRGKATGFLLRFEVIPKDVFAGTALFLTLILFATTTYGEIPGYVGGGKPIRVDVFTKSPELPGNRFIETRNVPQINMKLPSFQLQLLYESPDYIYFVTEMKDGITGYRIMRLRRDEVLRMDYVTPIWLTLGDN